MAAAFDAAEVCGELVFCAPICFLSTWCYSKTPGWFSSCLVPVSWFVYWLCCVSRDDGWCGLTPNFECWEIGAERSSRSVPLFGDCRDLMASVSFWEWLQLTSSRTLGFAGWNLRLPFWLPALSALSPKVSRPCWEDEGEDEEKSEDLGIVCFLCWWPWSRRPLLPFTCCPFERWCAFSWYIIICCFFGE